MMNIRFFLPLLLTVALTLPAMAQKKADKTVKQGTIVYQMVSSGPSDRQAVRSNATSLKLEMNGAAPAAPATPKETASKEKYTFGFDGLRSYALLPGVRYQFDRETNLVTQSVREAEESYFCAEYKLCQQDVVSCERAESYPEKLYIRTDETKEICGIKATRYELNFAKGAIWVAEEYTLSTWMSPFWGMNHPVLECDLPLFATKHPRVSAHLVAVEVNLKEMVVKKELFEECTPAELETLNEFISHLEEQIK